MGEMIEQIWVRKTSEALGAKKARQRVLDLIRRSPYRPAASESAAIKA